MRQVRLQVKLSALLLVIAITGNAQTKSAAENITGLYWSPGKDAKIEIYQRAGKYYGKSVWVASPKKDIKNPNKTLQTRDLLGIDLLNGFIYKDGSYSEGTVYDPENGKTYDCKISLNGNILKVRGFVGISLFGRTENFERIK